MRKYDPRRPWEHLALAQSFRRRPLRRGHNDILYPWEQQYVCHGRHAPARARASENRIERRTARQYLRGNHDH